MKKKQPKLSVLLNNKIGNPIGRDIYLNGYAIKQEKSRDEIVGAMICCSALNGAKFNPISEFIFSVKHRLGNNWINHPRWNEFLNFMMNKSFIKDVFLTKNVGNANKHGIRMNLEWSSNYILGGFFFIRCAWEYKYYLDSFFTMVDAGIDWNMALVQCAFMEIKNEHVIVRSSTGHTALGDLTEESCKKLLNIPLKDVEPNSPLKSGKFLSIKVNRALYSNVYGCSFIFYVLQKKEISTNAWGSKTYGYSLIDVLNKLKELQKEWQI